MSTKTLDSNEVKSYLPHRDPFLFVDEVLDYKEGEYIKAIKNVKMEEDFFRGHFPGYPVMPGVLIVEAIAQASTILYFLTKKIKDEMSPVFFMSADKCKFRSQVVPGDTLTLDVNVLQISGRVSKLQGKAYVGDKLVAEAVVTAMAGK